MVDISLIPFSCFFLFFFVSLKKGNRPFLFIFLLAEHHGYAKNIVLTNVVFCCFSEQCVYIAASEMNAWGEMSLRLRTCQEKDQWEILPNKAIRHIGTGKCIHPNQGFVCPKLGQTVLVHSDCSNWEDRTLFEFLQPPLPPAKANCSPGE